MLIHIKLTIMAFLWAGGFIAGKVITNQAGPFTVSFLRFLIASIIFAVLVYQKDLKWNFNMNLIICSIAAAFLGLFCYNYFFFSGIKLIDAGRGSVIISTVPIVVAFVSFAVFKESISLLKFSGIAFSVFGAWVVISRGQFTSILNDVIGLGEIYLILCVFCAAAFTFFSKQMLHTLSPIKTMFYVTALGALFLLVPAVVELKHIPIQYSPSFCLSLAYLSVGPSVIAVTFYNEAIVKVGPSKASQYMNLIPVFAVVLAVVFLGEQLSASLIVGGGLVSTGLYLTNFNT